ASTEGGRKRQALSDPSPSRSTVGATGPKAVSESASSRTGEGTRATCSPGFPAVRPLRPEWVSLRSVVRASPTALRERRSSHASDEREATAATSKAPSASDDPYGVSTIVASLPTSVA